MIVPPQVPVSSIRAIVESHARLYAGPEIDTHLRGIVRNNSHAGLSPQDLRHILRTTRSMFFNTHIEVVSGHHTGTYLRFESVARFPEFLTLIAQDMADWITTTYRDDPLAGILTTSSDARFLAERIIELVGDAMELRLVLTPFNHDTGKIGTEISPDAVRRNERFVSLNDITTRGMCVSKLGKVITDHGGQLAGMLVFARRDSGQFPLMDELTAQLPFYYGADLMMPQWEATECPLCPSGLPLFSWKDMPEL